MMPYTEHFSLSLCVSFFWGGGYWKEEGELFSWYKRVQGGNILGNEAK